MDISNVCCLRGTRHCFLKENEGDTAYIVDEGAIKVSRNDMSGCELTLATLERGNFSANWRLLTVIQGRLTAIAMKASELIVLDRKTFQDRVAAEPQLMDLVVKNFAKRIRRMDDLAMVLAYGANSQRLNFALQTLREKAKPDLKIPNTYIAKFSAKELANLAGVSEESAIYFSAVTQRFG